MHPTLVQRFAAGVLVALVSAYPASAADTAAAGRLSISIPTPVRVRDALRLLVRGTRFSLALDPAVQGTFAGDLKDVTLREALDAVLRPRSLTYSIEGTVIRVYPRKTESRFFTIDFVNVRRTWQRTLDQGAGASLTTLAGGDPYDDVERSVGALLSSDGRAHVDRRAGVITVTDYPDQLDRVAGFVETLLARSLRQVRLQVHLVDSHADTTLSLPDIVTLNNEPVVMRNSERDGATFALTVVAEVESGDAIQLSVSPSWSDRTGRSGVSDVVVRVRNGASVIVPVASGLTVQLTATVVAGGTP
ncbi:MAG TPA: secretin and TonB N-terminal domain-containing protein [Vicinamibacterales bacterium]|jgi:type II secretory pathway component GspD/PulD (secretin)|nr:secretin and TonB N-terminal domain-containing protein [Vicinamibacterales bacterium]